MPAVVTPLVTRCPSRAPAWLLGWGGCGFAGAVLLVAGAALAVAAAVGLVLLWRTDRIDLPAALGWTLLAVAVLGPVVWPWYETWGLTLVAVTARTAARRAVFVISAVGCFATIPSHVSAPSAALVVAAVLLALEAAALAIADVRCRHHSGAGTTISQLSWKGS